MTKTVTDVLCPFCGTLCDDLEVVVTDDGKTIVDVYNACAIGAEKFMHAQAKDRVKRPRMQQADGTYKEVSYDEAVEYTAQMLAN
ncbi:MAG: formylmethanofuran dehydrogenase subunit B, partial [Methanoregulaceae archaeon]